MNIIIYNINSFGGNYEYVKQIFKAYSKHPFIVKCILLMPVNSVFEGVNVKKILLSDLNTSQNKLIKKIYFLYRSIINPLKLFFFLKRQVPSIVLFNDFDQVTAIFWTPLFKLLKKKHRFAVILHDPDRDKFFPIEYLSKVSMKSIMSIMDIALYHGYLPSKIYYRGNFPTIKIPHGVYDHHDVNSNFLSHIQELTKGYLLIGVLGAIRPEKNYEIIIDAVERIATVKLLIAGKVANSQVSVEYYKNYAAKKKVSDRILWMEQYLEQEDFNAAIEACDLILLYYKPTFTSQSGVLNSIAAFNKKLIISDAKSSLRECVEEYDLGRIISHGDLSVLIETIQNILITSDQQQNENWKKYIQNSSWENNVSIAINNFKKLL